jgi:hypothetical protein
MGHRTTGIVPDLGTGCTVVGVRIVGIRKLVEDLSFSRRFEGPGVIDRPFHTRLLRSEYHFRSVRLHEGPPLGTHVLRHHEDHAIPLDRSNHRQRNPGVAAGRLDQGVPGADRSALLGGDDHPIRRAVLDRSRRIVSFELAEHGCGSVREPLQANDGSIADQVFHCFVSHTSHYKSSILLREPDNG